ncbi:hypothetical protein ALP10_200257 [Pseudomonas syringae pv. helianthi]|uniref:Uncharacterized protein n=1 Tax=Pseudomonas syringae pv. helianthi TaxID=251654 RepID=A0A3M6CND8_9PSED|nr:hypothetical protein ALP10_200257 [Pseudomonas syringae pv. helianthi]
MLFNREAVGQGIYIENLQIENQSNIGFVLWPRCSPWMKCFMGSPAEVSFLHRNATSTTGDLRLVRTAFHISKF